jgi:hypothetical protein
MVLAELDRSEGLGAGGSRHSNLKKKIEIYSPATTW